MYPDLGIWHEPFNPGLEGFETRSCGFHEIFPRPGRWIERFMMVQSQLLYG